MQSREVLLFYFALKSLVECCFAVFREISPGATTRGRYRGCDMEGSYSDVTSQPPGELRFGNAVTDDVCYIVAPSFLFQLVFKLVGVRNTAQ